MKSDTDRPSLHSDAPADDSRSDGTTVLSPDEIFHVLQTNRRRDVISYLLDEDGPVKMGHLAEVVSAKEHDTTVAQLTSKQRQRVYIPLYQTHLPKLDENGIIDYDKPRGIVRPAERLEVFRPYLEATGSSDGDERSKTGLGGLDTDRVSDYHVTAIGASAGLLAASVIGLVLIPGLLLAAIITLLFALATVATALSDFRPSTGTGGTGGTPPIH